MGFMCNDMLILNSFDYQYLSWIKAIFKQQLDKMQFRYDLTAI